MFDIHSLKISISLSRKAIFIFQAVFHGSGTITGKRNQVFNS
jgi:hypothetical protein